MRRGALQVGYVRPHTDMDPHYLEYATLREAGEQAARKEGGFVSPVALRRVGEVASRRGRDWTTAVLGHPYDNGCPYVELHMLLIANDRDLDPPLPERIAAQRAEQQKVHDAEREAYEARIAALQDEWETLAKAFPVKVVVVHNYQSKRHYENYVQGGDHIVVHADLSVGRLHRKAYQGLCQTPSYRHNLLLAAARDPKGSGDTRWPTCKKCIRMACKITSLDAPTLLSQR